MPNGNKWLSDTEPGAGGNARIPGACRLRDHPIDALWGRQITPSPPSPPCPALPARVAASPAPLRSRPRGCARRFCRRPRGCLPLSPVIRTMGERSEGREAAPNRRARRARSPGAAPPRAAGHPPERRGAPRRGREGDEGLGGVTRVTAPRGWRFRTRQHTFGDSRRTDWKMARRTSAQLVEDSREAMQRAWTN